MALSLRSAFLRNPLPMLSSVMRGITIKSWPTIDNPWREELETPKPTPRTPDYVLSKEEFKYVEMLKPIDVIPSAPHGVDVTPSGWIAPRPELSASKPYTVTRSSNHMLPVYLNEKERKRREQTHGKRSLTVIKNIGGDLPALAAELEALLKPKCEAEKFICQVDEATGKIIIDGIFLDEVAAFLLNNGF